MRRATYPLGQMCPRWDRWEVKRPACSSAKLRGNPLRFGIGFTFFPEMLASKKV